MAFRIPERVVEEIRSRTDLVALIGSRVELRRAGSDYKACCPFHHEKTPSFVVHPDKGFYHCFGCGKSGNAITFLMETDGLSFVEAVRRLGDACGVRIEEEDDGTAAARSRLYRLHAEICDWFAKCLEQAAEAAPARAYLKSRSLDGEAASRFRLGYCPSSAREVARWAERHSFTPAEMEQAGILLPPRTPGGTPFNRFGGRLMFSIRDRQGRVIAFSGRVLDKNAKRAKYVNSPETPVFVKANVLYALDMAAPEILKSPGRQVIVCEGQIDVIRCHVSGFPRAVASQGTAFSENHAAALKRIADSAVLLFDGDAAGRKAAIRTAGIFLKAEIPVKVATLPDGDDPDSFLLAKGSAAFAAALDAAEPAITFIARALAAAEPDPGSIEALKKVSAAALEIVAACPGAVMRAAMLKELSAALAVPESALADDMRRIAARKAAAAARRPEAAPPPAPEPHPAPAPAPGRDATDDAADDVADFKDVDYIPPELDAASPQNNPPPPHETAFCEFLAEHECDAALAGVAEKLLPHGLRTHPFTRKFADAWIAGAHGDAGALPRLFADASPAERDLMEPVLATRGKTAFSELPPERVMQDFLRALWSAEASRRLGELPAESTPENDTRRLAYSLLARRYAKSPWGSVAALMDLAVLDDPAHGLGLS